jgi:hypothetical protein
MNSMPTYQTNAAKALEVILWIANRSPQIDVYHLVKAVFFADKKHISEFGRPIVGDAYRAAPYGPLPQVIYGLLRNDPIEVLALESNGELPFSVTTQHKVIPERDPNSRVLSDSDLEALEYGLSHVEGRRFSDIYQETHDDVAYLRACGSAMDYRDFLSDTDENRSDKADYIEETARIAVL